MHTTEDKHFRRLAEVVSWSYSQQKQDRKIHQTLIRFMAGEYYPFKGEKAGPHTAVNLLSMASRAMGRHLISKEPRALVNTTIDSFKSWAENQEISTNTRITTSNAAMTLVDVVAQSLTSFGTLFFAPQYKGTPDGMVLDLAIESVDRADFVFDLEADTLETADYSGHKMRMKLVDIRENPMFDPECREEVTESGDESALDDQSSNFQKAFGNRTSLYDYAEVWCIYDRPRNKLIYFPKEQPSMRLAEIDWLGPRVGPYRHLYYEKLAGQAVPVAPLSHLLTKHRAYNELDMKAIFQQRTAKGILFYTNASKDEAERIIKAVEGQSVLQENGAIRYAHMGGADPSTVGMAEKQKADFSYASGGTVDQFQQQAPTFGQERLLRGAANEMMDDMSGWAFKFSKGFCGDVFWFDVRDPDPKPKKIRKQAGTIGSYEIQWTREHRQLVEQMEFDVDVEPYSYVEKSPDSRLADVLGALQIIQGLGDQAAAQGISIDVEAVVRTVAKYKNIPELYEVLILNQDPERLQALLGSRGTGGQTSPTAGKPNGQYTRTSESDGSGQAMETMRMMRGAGQQREMVIV